MDSSPPMLQVYRDDEHASVAAPLLPINQRAEVAHPRWAKQSAKNKKVVRGAIATGAFIATYLFFCAWVAFANNGSLAQRGDLTTFPHRRFPWPFPGRRHPHPHPHPHHWPHPEVLGCTAIPAPSADDVESTANVELNVTLPGYAPVLLGGMLLHGDVSVTKVNQSEVETMSVNRTMLVSIKVAKRTMRHPPPGAEEDPESDPESFVLCAIHPRRGPPPPPHPHPPTQSPPELPPHPPLMSMEVEEMGSEHPHPPHHPPHRGPPGPPHSPPVIVAIFPALNATYPKFPGPHGPPPPHGPPGSPEEGESVEMTASDSMLVAAWKSTVEFLFPMLSAFPHHRPHGPPCHHHKPPPPPSFWVTSLEATLPKCTRVLFGHGPPPHGPWRH